MSLLRALPIVLASLLLLAVPFTAIGRSLNDVIYVYDELGRLVAVIDPAGETATYSYDAAGNVISVSRYNSSVVSVVEFTPNSGPIGTTVTIYGTGFSTTPSQNNVSFNGVAATVTSSTFSQIVTTVPASATTGPITVTTPTGSAASADSFVVNNSAPPTITSFTPTIATIGTAVSITGTNFDASADRNRVKFNETVTANSAATTTSIDTKVPPATSSGRIKVATAVGSATSSADFFIPPLPYTAADVLVADRISLGDSRTVAMSVSNKIGLILFDATDGQRASVKVTSSTIASGTITIYDPKSAVLASTTFNTTSGYVDTPLFTTTGTYTILVDPTGTNTGNVSFTLYNASDLVSTLTIGGPTTAFSITTPGQNARISFTGTAGQRIDLGMTSVSVGTSSCCGSSVSITSSFGHVVQSPLDVGTTGAATNTLTLPVTGSYTLLVDPKTSNTGSISLTLTEELSGTISIGGSSQTLTFRPGQNGRLTFSGTAGQRVSLGISSVTVGAPYCCDVATAAIYNPDQTTLVASLPFGTGGEGTASAVLPASGTYTIVLDPISTKSGDATFTLSEDLSGTIAIGGSSVPLSLSRAGQNALLTFSGVAGQRVSIGMGGVTIGAGYCCTVAEVSIYNPNGTTLLTPYAVTTNGAGTTTAVLPTTGNYSIIISPTLARTGNVTVTLSEDLSGSISIGGSALPLSFRAGQNGLFTFTGTAGQRVSLGMSGVTLGGTYCCTVASVSIIKPDGTTLLNPFDFTTNGAGTSSVNLPVTGTYSIVMNPALAFSGDLTLTLSEDLTGPLNINGTPSALTFRSGQNGSFTFSGVAGQRISLAMSGITIGAGYCCNVVETALYKPDGTVLLSPVATFTSGKGTVTVILPVTGTYSAGVDPLIGFSGNMTLTGSEDVAGTASINGGTVPLTVGRVGQNAIVTFSGNSGTLVTVRITGNTLGQVVVKLLNPDGTTLTSLTISGNNFNLTQKTLPATGTYSITIDPSTLATGNITVAVTNP